MICCKLSAIIASLFPRPTRVIILPYFHMRITPLAFFWLICLCTSVLAGRPIGIRLFPESIELTNENSVQLVLIQTVLSDGTTGHVLDAKPEFRFVGPSLVSIESIEPGLFRLTTKQSGKTTLLVEAKQSDGAIAKTTATEKNDLNLLDILVCPQRRPRCRGQIAPNEKLQASFYAN